MSNPTVMVGECSIQVMLRGELVMTIPHRLWGPGMGEEGEVVWSGDLRGDHTTLILVRYLEGRIRGSEDQKDLFTRLYEVMGELKFSTWRKTMWEEGMEKAEKKKEKEQGRRKEPAGRLALLDREAPGEGDDVVELRRAA